MATRLELHSKFKELLGNNNVYYQPPESLKMEYPAIRYSRDDILSTNADDMKYSKHNRYQVIVIDKRPDNPTIEKLLELPYSSFDTHYVSNNLNHDVISLYY